MPYMYQETDTVVYDMIVFVDALKWTSCEEIISMAVLQLWQHLLHLWTPWWSRIGRLFWWIAHCDFEEGWHVDQNGRIIFVPLSGNFDHRNLWEKQKHKNFPKGWFQGLASSFWIVYYMQESGLTSAMLEVVSGDDTHTHFNPAKVTLKYISSKAKEVTVHICNS